MASWHPGASGCVRADILEDVLRRDLLALGDIALRIISPGAFDYHSLGVVNFVFWRNVICASCQSSLLLLIHHLRSLQW